MEQCANNLQSIFCRNGDKSNILDNLFSGMEQYPNNIVNIFCRDGDKGNILGTCKQVWNSMPKI